METLDATKTTANELELASRLNALSDLLQAEEDVYMASPVRSPLIVCRNEYAIGRLVNGIVDSDIASRCFEFLLPDDACAIELKRAAGRLLVFITESAPNTVEEFETHMGIEQLILTAIYATDDELRTWYIALVGYFLNERRGLDVADIAVVAVPSAPVSLPRFLFTRVRDILAPAFFASLRSATPAKTPVRRTVELEHALKCLASMGEYQEVLPPLLELNMLPVLVDLIQCGHEGVQFGVLELASRLIAHKTFALKFVNAGGVDVLLSVPTSRPIFLEASIAWCLSGLASLSTVMERILKTVADAPRRLVEFALTLLHGQQDITRKNALFFVAHALAFPALLHAFDNADGARVLLNLIAQPLALQRSISVANVLKHTTTALRQYFRAHVSVAAHLVRTTKVASTPANTRAVTAKRLPMSKPLHIDTIGHRANIEALSTRRAEVIQFLTQTKWRPVEELLTYSLDHGKNGIQLLLGLVKTCESEFGSNATETAACALQILAVASMLPLSYQHICAPVVALPDGFLRTGTATAQGDDDADGGDAASTGIDVMLQVAASDNVDGAEHVELILSALEALNNLVTPMWADEIAQRATRRAARDGNALHVLLHLLSFKGRLADSVRSLAVSCLLGLAKDIEVVNILATLNVDRVLSEIAHSELTVAEQAAVHRRLKRGALELLRVISGGKVDEGEISLATDAAARKIARDAIVRRTHVQFHRRELLELVHDHLDKLGLTQSARALFDEAGLGGDELVDARKRHWLWPKVAAGRHDDKRPRQTPLRRSTSLSSAPTSTSAPGTPAAATTTTTAKPQALSVWRSTPQVGRAHQAPTALERLVREHLRHQHEKCPNPISVPPPFPLLDASRRHVCPHVKPRSAPLNATRRLLQRQIFPPFGGLGGHALNVRSVHKQARWVRTYTTAEPAGSFTCLAFRECAGRDDEIVIGADDGGALRFNAWTAEPVGYWDMAEMLGAADAQTHLATVQFERDLVLTTSEPARAVVWRMATKDDIQPVARLGGVQHSVLSDGMVVAAVEGARVVGLFALDSPGGGEFDTPTTSLSYEGSNEYEETNVAKFGSLVMFDGLLFDVRRSARPVFKFDKLSPYGRAAFNPSGLNVLLNKDVWDLRNFRLAFSAPDVVDGAQSCFDHAGDVLFSHVNPLSPAYSESRLAAVRDAVVVTDASSWTPVASYHISKPTRALALHPNGGHFAIVTYDADDHVQNEARLYEIGRGKPDDNDSDMDDAQKEDDAMSASHSDSSDEYAGHDDDVGLGEIGSDADFNDVFMRAMHEIMHHEEDGEDDDDDDDGDDSDGDGGDDYQGGDAMLMALEAAADDDDAGDDGDDDF